MRVPLLLSYDLGAAVFARISQIIYEQCGITLKSGKEGLVKARLTKRLYALGLGSFEAYLQVVEADASGKELTLMIDALTTNKTSFFREVQHFEYLQQHIVPQLVQSSHPIRFWSAGCSSGEEPYSLAMVLAESIPASHTCDLRILATDISTRTLALARQATYEKKALNDVPSPFVRKYFTAVRHDTREVFQLNNVIRSMVQLARLNLIHEWPMRGPFDAIFCRNVMIYFDKPTQNRLVQRFRDLLRPGGHLFIGHSESLSGTSHGLSYVQPALYMK